MQDVGMQDDERVQNWMKQGKYYDEENYGEAMKYYRLAADGFRIGIGRLL